ncbi:hypothetical protein [Parvibaculum sp.]|uniref:hypothetical protein n=1 Tax=Parvibaculum sp. TaxID=2024848 RepID=UPI003BACF551
MRPVHVRQLVHAHAKALHLDEDLVQLPQARAEPLRGRVTEFRHAEGAQGVAAFRIRPWVIAHGKFRVQRGHDQVWQYADDLGQRCAIPRGGDNVARRGEGAL